MSASTTNVLLADIGGTNGRFALLCDGTMTAPRHLRVAEFATFADAVTTFLATEAKGARPTRALLGVAGPVDGERCRILNSHWNIDGPELRARFGFAEVRLLNDFEALAWSLPKLAPPQLRNIGGGSARAGEPMLVVGPGTGLGAAGLLHLPTGTVVVSTEAGHATLPGMNAREDAVIAWLRQRGGQVDGHVSAERALSGGGLENLYNAIAAIAGATVPARDAASITAAALDGSCPVSHAALSMFCAMLGTITGNLALTFRARGGVFIGGGMAPRFADFLVRSEFRARFEAKGRFRDYLAAIPVHLICNADTAFLGLQAVAETAPPVP